MEHLHVPRRSIAHHHHNDEGEIIHHHHDDVEHHHHKGEMFGHHHGVGSPQDEIGHRASDKRRLLFTIVITGSMMVVELVGGILTNSLALISDAGHMFTHFFALAVSYTAIVFAVRPASKDRSFGYYRVEVLAALFNGITLLLITAYIFWEGYKRILAPEPIEELPMFVVAVVGLVVNLISAVILSGTDRGDLNLKSAFLHMIGDTASSIAIVAGAIVIYYTNWLIVDPLLSVLIAILILIWSMRLLKDSINVLLESAPKHIKSDDVGSVLLDCGKPEVKGVHDIHVWEITSKMYSMTAHVIVNDIKVSDTNKLLERINHTMDERFGIQHTNIQFECER